MNYGPEHIFPVSAAAAAIAHALRAVTVPGDEVLEWSDKKENWRPKGWSKAAAACVIVTLGSVIFSNPHIQASIKNITLSIGETLGFPKSIESYTEVLNTSKEDKGITVTNCQLCNVPDRTAGTRKRNLRITKIIRHHQGIPFR